MRVSEHRRQSRRWALATCLGGALALAGAAARAAAVSYQVRVAEGAPVHVTIRPPAPVGPPAVLIMPRGYPGGYSIVPYDRFVRDVHGFDAAGAALPVRKDPDGPRWQFAGALARLEYDVDVGAMERELRSAVESSKVRSGYAGLLGYSVFGFVEGTERAAIELDVEAPAQWPVLTTLAPAVPAPLGHAAARAPAYERLADAQILLGPELRLRRVEGAIPLVMAVYAETPVDLDAETEAARIALARVQAYFGDAPMAQYTVQLELLRPLPDHGYGFSQEHFDSGTFSLGVDRALSSASSVEARELEQMNYAHHMAHSWIPKRAWGEGYAPFSWEVPPVLDMIWFHEGWGRYAAIAALAAGMPAPAGAAFRERRLAALRQNLAEAPPFLRALPLATLSREASYLYGTDFRLGKNVFSRGALMAAEIDERIERATAGRQGLRDALRGILAEATRTKLPLNANDLARLVRETTGVAVTDAVDRWMAPLP